MDVLPKEEVLRLLRYFGLKKRRSTIDPSRLFCAVCNVCPETYVYSMAPNYYTYIANLRQKLHGPNSIFCSRACFIKFVQEHAGDILMAMLKDDEHNSNR